MDTPILMTGAAGLIGRALARALERRGRPIVPLDLLAPEPGDTRRAEDVVRALAGCGGIVHLAAVSRVIWGERDPGGCRATNVGGTRNVLAAALAADPRPWVLFASSREIYGQADALPVTEDAPARAMNVYGHTKVAGEALVGEARAAGLHAAVVRLSNVYGCPYDHRDRVVPAFVRGALGGGTLRIEGPEHTFDFTHIDDVTRGLLAAIDALDAGEELPDMHLLTGVPTTLRQLAHAAVDLAGVTCPLVEAAPRSYDVARFVGDPSRARAVLGWEARVGLREGLSRFIAELRSEEVAP